MTEIQEGDLLWKPPLRTIQDANLTRYISWLIKTRGLRIDGYRSLWEWSVTETADFWRSLWDYFEVIASEQPDETLSGESMPGVTWFSGARLNYTENFFVRADDERTAILYKAEDKPVEAIKWKEICDQAWRLATYLREIGVQEGDRVVAYLPNIPEAIIGLFACASLGAIWSSSSPDFGSRSVLDRFQQIEPKVLLAVDGYNYNGKPFDRHQVVAELQGGLPTLEKTILVPLLSEDPPLEGLEETIIWSEALNSVDLPTRMTFAQVPFDHPLWVLYSSGTTGRPKPIVHSHGGILLEHLKETILHLDLKPHDKFFWFTSTGWMMWNFIVGGLLSGCTIILYNGSPGYPSMMALWELAAETGMTYFGTSAAFISACMKAEIRPSEEVELSAIRAVGSTGSPLTVANFEWIYKNINQYLALESVSGGTDLCTAFVGGCRLLPIYAGEIQGAALGAKIEAYDDSGEAVVGEVGELVITKPMPSMPIYFWNDPEMERYTGSYFEMYPGVWRHGDWIKFNERGGCVIYGRSDSTINRQGIRMGTSEIYQAVESLPEIMDSLIVDLELLGRESYMPLFLVLREGVELNDDLTTRLKKTIRRDISPRHVPDEIFVVDEIPYTLSGKKMEVPIRRILLGQPVEKAANPGAMRNPGSLQFFIDLAEKLNT